MDRHLVPTQGEESIGHSPRHAAVSQGLQLLAILLAALCVLNLGYGFENTMQRLDKFSFVSQTLGGTRAHRRPGREQLIKCELKSDKVEQAPNIGKN